MRQSIPIIAAAALAVGTLGLSTTNVLAQQGQDPSQGSQQQQQQQPGSSYGGVGSSAQTAGSQQPGQAGQNQEQQKQVQETLSTTVQSVIDGKWDQFRQGFSQNDQQRLSKLDEQGQQVKQAIDQLKQDYKAKYGQDLDLSKNREVVFSNQFFQIGSGLGGQAQPAGATIGGSSSTPGSSGSGGSSGTPGSSGSGTSPQSSGSSTPGSPSGDNSGMAGSSGTSGAGASARNSDSSISGSSSASGSSGMGSNAQTAGSTSGQTLNVTIPESHGLPQANVTLSQESGRWVINLPAGTDAQQLTQRLQQQIQQCSQKKDQWPSDQNDGARQVSHAVLLAIAGDQSSQNSAPGSSGAGSSGMGTGGSGTSGSGMGAGSSGSTGGQPESPAPPAR